MTAGGSTRDLDYQSRTLPRGTFVRSIFDNLFVRLSDRGGASQLIGAAWSEATAAVLESWIGNHIPHDGTSLAGGQVGTVHRLDTLPGVAARASKVGLKNPDFILFASREGQPIVFGVDAKFSVETARPVQVSADTTAQLFETDARLTSMLPEQDPGAEYVDGLFVSPDYPLTHAMFRHKVGHRRLTVSPDDVVLADVDARDVFGDITQESIIDILRRIDDLPFSVWESLLAAQYYFRVERAIIGLVADEQKPLLGTLDIDATEDDLVARIDERAGRAESAWQMVLDWDQDVEQIRRQRQAMHQVVGSPLSGTELRDLSDTVMDRMGLERRPSRNQVRKALGSRFTGDVLARVGVIVPPVRDFASELERVGIAAREVTERYAADMPAILEDIIRDLVDGDR